VDIHDVAPQLRLIGGLSYTLFHIIPIKQNLQSGTCARAFLGKLLENRRSLRKNHYRAPLLWFPAAARR
jgi:hypothetical protein